MPDLLRALALVGVATLVVGCSSPSTTAPGTEPGLAERLVATPGASDTATDAAPDPDDPTGWGPTVGEVEQAVRTVEDWSPARLAGQVIVGRYYSTDPAEAADLVADLHLAGVSLTTDNIVDAEQVRATTAAIADAVADSGRAFPGVVGVDQEGGLVSHLRGVATDFPAFAEAGERIAEDRRTGLASVRRAAETTALELRDLGFTWVFAPVADVTIGAADPTIGTRSPSGDPRLASLAVGAAVRGYDDAGLVSTTKHFPGHGGVTQDSHQVMPRLETTLGDLRRRDLRPFAAAVDAAAPSIMISHIAASALAPEVPASLAPEIYTFLREELGFGGVAITDSLGMGAVTSRRSPALQAIEAGADLLLMPADTRRTHAQLVRALKSGDLDRERVVEAAARVVAVQLWQARVAGESPVPADIADQALQASADLAQ